MNLLNHCTLEAAQRLHEAGIKIKTEIVWRKNWDSTWSLSRDIFLIKDTIPAPCFTEVWRELSKGIIMRKFTNTWVWVDGVVNSAFHNENPTDALIDLLIWVKGREKP